MAGPSSESDAPARLLAIRHAPEQVERSSRQIYEAVLDRSGQIRVGNFLVIGVDDLRHLFDLYDDGFFDGLLRRMLREGGSGEVAFRLSSRMTRTAGKTTMLRPRARTPGGRPGPASYEIAISTLLLFQNFGGPGRSVTVGGLPCADRLEVLQRIFEHELLHLAEFLAWEGSSCSAPRFHALSRRIFGHEGTTHDLVTPREHAAQMYQIRVGDLVRFEHEGIERKGRVNRITRRATVLVEDPRGRPYSDGRRYATFYVPVPMLRRLDGPPETSRGSAS